MHGLLNRKAAIDALQLYVDTKRNVAIHRLDHQAPIFLLDLLPLCAYHISLLAEFDEWQVSHEHLVHFRVRHCFNKLKLAR